ncbi:MAG: hypothetical protein WCX48_08710 [Bacteroidales bacterium]
MDKKISPSDVKNDLYTIGLYLAKMMYETNADTIKQKIIGFHGPDGKIIGDYELVVTKIK